MKTFNEFLENEHDGIYSCVKFSDDTNWKLKNYTEKLGLTPVPFFHSTIIYSEKNLPGYELGFENIEFGFFAKPIGLKYLGEKESEWRALTLLIESDFILNKFNEAVKAGYIHTYEKFIPHVSLAYKPIEGLDLDKISLPDFELEINQIKITELNPGG